MILARLLTPGQIGLFSVTMVLLSYVSSLRDMGAGQYLIQEPDITPNRLRAAWTVQLFMGILIAVFVLAAAKPVAAFYNEPKIFDLMLLLALNFAISPFGSLTYAWLMREMSFGKLATMRFVSALTGATTTVYLAWLNFGAMSLAIGSVAGTLANCLVSIAYRPRDFPFTPGGLSEVSRVLRYGSKISLITVINSFVYSLPEIFIGKFQNMSAVGYYSRATGLLGMFNKLIVDALQSVLTAKFAQDFRAKEEIAPKFLLVISYLTGLGWPFFGFVAIFPSEIVYILYGPQWESSSDILPPLAVGASLMLTAAVCTNTLNATGHISRSLKTTLISAPLWAIPMTFGSMSSLTTLGYCAMLAGLLHSGYWIFQTKKVLRFEWKYFLSILFRSLVTTLFALLPAFLLNLHVYRTQALVYVSGAGLMTAIALITSLAIFKHPLSIEISTLFNRFKSLNQSNR